MKSVAKIFAAELSIAAIGAVFIGVFYIYVIPHYSTYYVLILSLAAVAYASGYIARRLLVNDRRLGWIAAIAISTLVTMSTLYLALFWILMSVVLNHPARMYSPTLGGIPADGSDWNERRFEHLNLYTYTGNDRSMVPIRAARRIAVPTTVVGVARPRIRCRRSRSRRTPFPSRRHFLICFLEF